MGRSGASEENGRRVTMETVGRLAGVSQVTVSRALSDPSKVSPATLERIREAIELTGYVPNAVAGALASRRSRLIAAFVPSITNIVYSSTIQSFSAAIRKAGYQVLLSETGFDPEEERSLVAALLSRRPDGVLLTGVHHSPACRRMLLAAEIPVVEVWDVTETPIDTCVGFSHAASGAAAAAYAMERGYERFAAASAGDERALRRKDAFAAALAAAGRPAPMEVCFGGEASIQRGREALSTLLGQGFRNGIVFCSSDLLAHGVLIEAQARGLGVPNEVAAIGFGDQTFAPFTLPALTSIRVDRAVLGRRAAEALLSRLNGEGPAERRIDIGFEIIRRESA